MTAETWEKCGPFGEHEDTWSVEVLGPHGGIVCETYAESFADEIVADHTAASTLRAMVGDVPEWPLWALKGRDGEPVTLFQQLEQAIEFGTAMERLAIENNATADALRAALTEAQAALALYDNHDMRCVCDPPGATNPSEAQWTCGDRHRALKAALRQPSPMQEGGKP